MTNVNLAVKLHDNCCPHCNGRCRAGIECPFDSNLDVEKWDENKSNIYFADLTEKAEKIMQETNLTEEEFLQICKDLANKIYPSDEIYELMKSYGFI